MNFTFANANHAPLTHPAAICSTLKKKPNDRETLHELIDRIPESEIVAVQRVLTRLASDAAFRAAMSAPPDDEPVIPGDAEAIARARKDLQAGMAVSHDEILREFGIRERVPGSTLGNRR